MKSPALSVSPITSLESGLPSQPAAIVAVSSSLGVPQAPLSNPAPDALMSPCLPVESDALSSKPASTLVSPIAMLRATPKANTHAPAVPRPINGVGTFKPAANETLSSTSRLPQATPKADAQSAAATFKPAANTALPPKSGPPQAVPKADAHCHCATQELPGVGPSLDLICLEIREAWYQRQMLVREHGNLVRQLKAICRRMSDGDKTRGTELFKKLTRGKADQQVLGACMLLLKHCNETAAARSEQERLLYLLTAQLPVYDWVQSIRGCSDNALASIIGESGNLDNYDNPAKLWKRMGIGLVEHKGKHIRQAKSKTKALAELMGYSPKRRAILFVIGGNIIKARKGATGLAAELLTYYEAEKAKAIAAGLTRGHAHKRAQRHMEKRFLKLLWREWTKSPIPEIESQRLAA